MGEYFKNSNTKTMYVAKHAKEAHSPHKRKCSYANDFQVLNKYHDLVCV
jgi:hypothetical protein